MSDRESEIKAALRADIERQLSRGTAPSEAPLTDKDRLDWLEQVLDAETAVELVINWTFAGKRHEKGIRSAIDAAIKGEI